MQLLFLALFALIVWPDGLLAGLTEFSGFHCSMRHTMRMNRRIHGPPQTSSPPFKFYFTDTSGQQTRYYTPGQIYTVRLISYVHFRGFLMQSRLTNENGFMIGALTGGRFIKTPNWERYGIRIQNCQPKGITDDSITHAGSSKKFLIEGNWTTDREVGPVQFMMTVASDDHIYWERWRPESGLILPADSNYKLQDIIEQVFTDEKSALKYAGILKFVRLFSNYHV